MSDEITASESYLIYHGYLTKVHRQCSRTSLSGEIGEAVHSSSIIIAWADILRIIPVLLLIKSFRTLVYFRDVFLLQLSFARCVSYIYVGIYIPRCEHEFFSSQSDNAIVLRRIASAMANQVL